MAQNPTTSVKKPLICWISHRPVRFESQHYMTLSRFLSQNGYEVKWLEAPFEPAQIDLPQWVETNVSKQATAIFFAGRELAWFQPILDGIRATASPTQPSPPIFWIYEDVDHALLEKMVEEGFDDFLHVSVKPHELLLRLKLQTRRIELKTKSDLATREQNAKLAKAETIIKQREEFLGVCAHDLRSPLGLIQSSSSLILRSIAETHTFSPTHLELLNRIRRQATQAIGLVNDLLDVMSYEQGLKPEYQMFNLHDFLREFHQDYQAQAEQKQIKLHYENPIAHWRVLGDADRVRQLLQNLLTNAIKFTEAGKNIFIKVSSFTGRRKNDPIYPMVVISVRDEGKGIPQSEVQKVFDRFSQLKDQSRGEGRGLGLTVAKQISNLHDGNIWIESVEGQGSTFFALLPHAISRSNNTKMRPRNRPVVLVGEPDLARRAEYFSQLEDCGVEIYYARDMVETLGMLFHLLPDVCILTSKLQKMSVLEMVAAAKSDVLTATIPLMIAGEESEKLEQHLDTHKFDRFLKLPFSLESAETTLRSVGVQLASPKQKKAA